MPQFLFHRPYQEAARDGYILEHRHSETREILDGLLVGIREVFESMVNPARYAQCPVCRFFFRKYRKDQVACREHAGTYRVQRFRASGTPEEKEKQKERDALRKKVRRGIKMMATKMYDVYDGKTDRGEWAESIRRECYRRNEKEGGLLSREVIDKIIAEIDEWFFTGR